jgi:predicted chitinase
MTIEITADHIQAIAPGNKFGSAKLADALTVACNEWEIDTPARAAMFLAQLARGAEAVAFVRECRWARLRGPQGSRQH